MLSLLEASAIIASYIFILLNKTTTLINLILGIIVYDIILPHAFLMNTSENKNRIVELGWKNVFKNILAKSNNSVGICENTAAVNVGSGDSKMEREQKGNKRTRSKQPEDGNCQRCIKSVPVNNPKDGAISNVMLNGDYSGKTDTDIDNPNFATLNVNNLEQRGDNNSVGNSNNTSTVNIASGHSEIDKEQKDNKRKRSKQPGDGNAEGCNKFFPVNYQKYSAISNVTLNWDYSGYTDTDIDKPNFATLNVNNLE